MESFLEKVYLLKRRLKISLRSSVENFKCLVFFSPNTSKVDDILLTLIHSYLNSLLQSKKCKGLQTYFLPIITPNMKEIFSINSTSWDIFEYLEIEPDYLIFLESVLIDFSEFNDFSFESLPCTMVINFDSSIEILSSSNDFLCKITLSSLINEIVNKYLRLNEPFDVMLSKVIAYLFFDKTTYVLPLYDNHQFIMSSSFDYINIFEQNFIEEIAKIRHHFDNSTFQHFIFPGIHFFQFEHFNISYSFIHSSFLDIILRDDFVVSILEHLSNKELHAYVTISPHFELNPRRRVVVFFLKFADISEMFIWQSLMDLLSLQSDLGLEPINSDISENEAMKKVLIKVFHQDNLICHPYFDFVQLNKLIHCFVNRNMKKLRTFSNTSPPISSKTNEFSLYIFSKLRYSKYDNRINFFCYFLYNNSIDVLKAQDVVYFLLMNKHGEAFKFFLMTYLSLMYSFRIRQLEKYKTFTTEIGDVIHPPVDCKRLRRKFKRVMLNDIDYILDMELIENYRKTFQHGGYIRDRSRLPVVFIIGKHLPLKFVKDYDTILKQLFYYILSILGSLIFDNYILIYFHSGVTQQHLPQQYWIRQFYEMINDKLKKSLKNIYIVNPTPWVKTMLKLSKPFISKKFYEKIKFVKSMNELLKRVPIDKDILPLDIKL